MKRNELFSKVIRMGKMVLPFYLFTFLPLSMSAQDDDMYFVPTKENKAKEAKKYGMPEKSYYSGINQSVDEYNRRVVVGNPADTTANDIIDFSAVRGVYPDTIYSQQVENDDYTLTRQMSRFDDYTPSEAYWDGYRAGRWSSPWYNSWYSWYDPWAYDPLWYWNDPFYYSSWYGWRYPYYYSWYSPRYYGYYGYYGYYRPWYGGGYVSRGTSSHMSPNLRSYERRNYNSDGTRRSGVGSRVGNVGVGSRQGSSGVGSRSSGSFGSSSGSGSRSSGSFSSPSSGASSRSSGSFSSSSSGSFGSSSSGGGSRSSGGSGGGGGVRNSGGRR